MVEATLPPSARPLVSDITHIIRIDALRVTQLIVVNIADESALS
jgi:hypothetical protein